MKPMLRNLLRPAITGLLAFLIGFGPITPLAWAGPSDVPLADAPIQVKVKAPPNIVFTLDDSTSMQLDFLPDYVVVNSATNAQTAYCRSATGLTACGSNGSAALPQYIYAEWNMTGLGIWPAGYGGSSYAPPAPMTAAFNTLYYNPTVTYKPPMKSDKTSYPTMDATNTTNWTKVYVDVWKDATKFVNLQTKVNVGIWCNSDYSAANNGDQCRVNGKSYAAGANGAPKVDGDYNYPFAKVAADADNSKYFSQTQTFLWCDKTKLDWTADTPKVACGSFCPVALVNSPPTCDPLCTNPAECSVCTKVCPVAQVPNPSPCGIIPGAPITTCANKPASLGGAKTLLADANDATAGGGKVCRRNNFAYADGQTTGGWTMPTGAFTTKSAACANIALNSWRHYYKASMVWCKKQVGLATNNKWRGFGDYAAAGDCQLDQDATYKWPRFFQYLGDYTASNVTTPAFEMIEIDFTVAAKPVLNTRAGTIAWGGNISHTKPNGDIVTRTVAEEITNYANWFAYYRTRILAAKTVTSTAFSELTDKFRVGFHTLSNSPATTFQTLGAFGGTQRDDWYTKLFGVSIPMGNATPLLDGVVRIGEWFRAKSGTSAALSGSTDPITLSCQKNYHILFTDGYTNQAAIPATVVNNTDGSKIPATGATLNGSIVMPEVILGLTPGTAWPDLYIENNAKAVDNSLSDYALQYWMSDLRNPTDGFSAKISENNVTTSSKDPAKWQHLNFAALSLGTQGVLPSRNVTATETLIGAKTLKWTTPAPTVNRPGVTGVDDLWHAAIVGRSQFVNARDPEELAAGLADILNEIQNIQAARAGATVQNVNFSSANNYVYRVTTEPGWGGTLTKVLVDATDGSEVSIDKEFHKELLAQVTGAGTPWLDNRAVVTCEGTAPAAPKQSCGRRFILSDIPTTKTVLTGAKTQLETLGKDATEQGLVIDYIRGDRSKEGISSSDYRKRTQILGDIVGSSPVTVGNPSAPYSDATDPGYSTYKGTTRQRMVYVGANDGMLHAFDENTGKEVWAYIPSFAYNADPFKGLKMLTIKEPFFKHQMFVDSTPVAVDVDIDGKGKWRTYLFGGLGKGGQGVYAIDITDPDALIGAADNATREKDAAKNIKWEFTDPDMGYTYGKPLVAKIPWAGYASGRWVVGVTSGYNNTSGKGKLWLLDVATGSVLTTFTTSASLAGEKSGLAQVSGFVLDYHNQMLEQIYGGDLLGNLWRFEITPRGSVKYGDVTKFATLTDGAKAQSVTIAPQIEVDIENGVDRYVMIGTGRLLDETDLDTFADQVQTMYVFRDGTTTAPLDSGLPIDPRDPSTGIKALTDLTNGFGATTPAGWYHDLALGERIITPIQAEVNTVVYAGALPPDNECITGQAANIYGRSFTSGASALKDSSGTRVDSVYSKEGAVGLELVKLYSTDTIDVKVMVTLGTDGKTQMFDIALPFGNAEHRMSWRLLGQ